jgi:uncharacterized Ntn-hydrolase superfamily protein
LAAFADALRGFFVVGFDAASLTTTSPETGSVTPEPAAEVLEIVAEAVENANHLRPRLREFLQAGPFADDAKRSLAGLDQSATAETVEAAMEAAMRRDEILLVARFDAEPHNIERRHVVLPVISS